eukprot:CAMPEP_0172863700 /NCGR_PEP_ID=MMETSP1075-20121228/78090_1 /TAXON_ID=2916 /ORGANISM="Ceratium fusus, Strain PA161109" /LENGTH=77 /DNA_ID=CAMNT_0013712389 /DNA_START=63 /DNA_END=292 /DNA_ORIENTATION=-
MTSGQYVHHARPMSKSNFTSFAIDAVALPQQWRQSEWGLTGAPPRNSSRSEHPQDESSLASMVLFDALALDAGSCPR